MTATVSAKMVENLHDLHAHALRRFLARMVHNEEVASDAAQETWARLLRLANWRIVADPRAFVFKVGANVARDQLIRQRRQRPPSSGTMAEAEALAGSEPDSEAAALSAQRLRLLARAVDELPPRCREVFLMSRRDGLSNGAIAARLGISRNAVEKHIIRAMLHCRRHLAASGA